MLQHVALSASSRLALFFCLSALAGCGGGSAPIAPAPVQTGPASASEILYLQSIYDNGLTLSSVDPASGIVGPMTYAINNPGLNVGYFNLSHQPRPMTLPSAKYLYVAGLNAVGTGIFAFSIAGTTGQLTPIQGFSPDVPTTPLKAFVTGAVISGQGQYIYVSDSDADYQRPTEIRAFVVDSSTGKLKDGPILSQTSPTTLALNGSDSAGKFVYAWAQSSKSLSLSAYVINASTGSLTEVPGSPYFLIANNEPPDSNLLTTLPMDFVVSASGRFVYAAVVNINPPGSATYETQAVFGFSVDAVTGALTPVPGSPFSLGNMEPFAMALHPNGKFLYVASTQNEPLFKGTLIFAVDPTVGSLSGAPISTVAGACCGPMAMDPAGTVLISEPTAGSTSGGSSYRVDATNGLLTPAQGSSVVPGLAPLIVKIP